jgi:L-asparagine transporter-like permease
MVFFASFLPILVGTGASSDSYTEWSDGYFLHIAAEIGGPWLSYWMMIAAATTNIGMFEAEMSSDAWQVCGMAERGILPKFLARRNQYGTPLYGILLSATGIVCLGTLAFSEVIDLVNLLFCLGQAIGIIITVIIIIIIIIIILYI